MKNGTEYPGEIVYLTEDQKKLIRIALLEYFFKMSHENMDADTDEYGAKTVVELIVLHECENIFRKIGMESGYEKPSYFSITPNTGETPEEFCARINTRSWLEFD